MLRKQHRHLKQWTGQVMQTIALPTSESTPPPVLGCLPPWPGKRAKVGGTRVAPAEDCTKHNVHQKRWSHSSCITKNLFPYPWLASFSFLPHQKKNTQAKPSYITKNLIPILCLPPCPKLFLYCGAPPPLSLPLLSSCYPTSPWLLESTLPTTSIVNHLYFCFQIAARPGSGKKSKEEHIHTLHVGTWSQNSSEFIIKWQVVHPSRKSSPSLWWMRLKCDLGPSHRTRVPIPSSWFEG